MRHAWWLAAAVGAGCGYPSFAFDASDASVGDVGDASAESLVDEGASDVAPSDGGDESLEPDAIDATDIPDATDATDAVGADDGAEVDAGPIGCVGSTALFCADFDHVTTPDVGWGGVYVAGGGTNAFDSTAYSSPNSYLSTLPVTSATEVSATIFKSFTASTDGATARIDARVWIEIASDPDDVVLFKLQGSGTGYGAGLSLDSSGLTVETVGSPGDKLSLGVSTPTGRWIHFRMDAQLVVTGAHVTVWMDDMTKPLFDRSDLSTATTAVTDYDLALGVYCPGPTTTAIRVRFDDVSFDFP